MGDVAKEGRTVLFVSHNMAAVENLCSRAILLHNGRIFSEGETRSVIRTYLQSLLPEASSSSLLDMTERGGTGEIRFTYFHVEDIYGNKLPVIQSGQDIFLVFGFKYINNEVKLKNIDFRFGIYTLLGERLINFRSSYVNQIFDSLPLEGEAHCFIPKFPLAQGRYIVNAVIAANNKIIDSLTVGTIDVEFGDFWQTGRIPSVTSKFLIIGKWEIKTL